MASFPSQRRPRWDPDHTALLWMRGEQIVGTISGL